MIPFNVVKEMGIKRYFPFVSDCILKEMIKRLYFKLISFKGVFPLEDVMNTCN